MFENRKYQYSILSTFIGLIFLLIISIILTLGWQGLKLKENFDQEELKTIAENINHGTKELLKLYETKLELLQRIVVENKYYDNQDVMNHLVTLLFDDNDNQFLHNAIWQSTKLPPHIKPPQNYVNKVFKAPISIKIINDEHGNKRGEIITEIKINYLKKYIEHIIKEKEIYYALIAKNDFRIIDGKVKNAETDNLVMINVFHRYQKNLLLTPLNEKSNSFYTATEIDNLGIGVVLAKPKESNYTIQLNLIAKYHLEIIFSLFLLFMLFNFFYRAILAPFIMLSNAALEISNGNIPLISAKMTSSKEGLLVATALNKIKSSINLEKELVKEVTKAHNKLSITNLRLENKVASRTQELEQALQAKDRFISYLTYELRTPLKGLTNLVQTTFLKWQDLTNDQKIDFSQHVIYTLNRLMSLINGMISISKSSSGNLNLKLSNFCMTDLVEEIVTECKILHLSRKKIIINFLCEEKFFILADKDKIAQVIRNIIISSIERSDNNNSIAIKLIKSEITDEVYKTKDNAIQFTLYDNAGEIAKESISSLFSRKNNKIENIPLNISSELIMLHHGKIWAENNNDGGLTMNFIIPVNQYDKNSDDQPNYIDIHPTKYNILMIDDEESCTTGMEIQLRNTKYNLIKCNNAQAGLDYLSQNYHNIAIILLDLMMPDIYGLNVLNEIRANNNYDNISIILQTGSTDEEEIVKAFNIGINCFIKKPYNKKMILRELEKALRLHNLTKET